MCFASHFLWYTLISLVYIFLEGREENYPNTAWVQLNSGHTLCGTTRHEERHCPHRFASAYRLRCSRPAFYSLPTQGTVPRLLTVWIKQEEKVERCGSPTHLSMHSSDIQKISKNYELLQQRDQLSPLTVFGNKRGHFKYLCYGQQTKSYVRKEGRRSKLKEKYIL